jgi:hypothetical protein
MTTATLETIDDRNWREFLEAPVAVLVLAISNCEACARWQEELGDWLGSDGAPTGIRFGRIVLDSADSREFKAANDWLDEIPGVPFTAIFEAGEPRSSLAGVGVGRLGRRLARLQTSDQETTVSAPQASTDSPTGAQAPTTVR